MDPLRLFARGQFTDAVMTPDGRSVLAVAADGSVTRYDLATGARTGSWAGPFGPDSADVTADGRYLVGHGTYTNRELTRYTAFVSRLDLASGRVFLARSDAGGASLQAFDVATGTFGAVTAQSVSGYGLVVASTSRDVFVDAVGAGGVRSLFAYAPDATLLADTSGAGATTTLAVANGGTLVAELADRLYVHDTRLDTVVDLSQLQPAYADPRTSSIAGLAFSPDGERLYLLDVGRDQVVQVSTTEWSVQATYDAGAHVSVDPRSGDRIVMSGDGHYMSVLSDGGLQVLDLRLARSSTATVTTGTADTDRLVGGTGPDRLFGLGGDDVLVGGGGVNELDGGAGFDTADARAFFRGATVDVVDGSVVLASGAERSWLTGIERVRFQDGHVDLDPDGAGAFVYRLYDGLLGETPERYGFEYWSRQIEWGLARTEIANTFLQSAQAPDALRATDPGAFVDALYDRVLHRAADAGGRDYWAGQLAAGASHADVAIAFSEGAEHRAATQAGTDQGFWFVDPTYAAVAALYDVVRPGPADATGLIYWSDQVKDVASLMGVARQMVDSIEFRAEIAGFTNAEIVDFLYDRALGRAADQAGSDYWTDRLDAGASVGDLLLAFTFGEEHLLRFLPGVLDGVVVA